LGEEGAYPAVGASNHRSLGERGAAWVFSAVRERLRSTLIGRPLISLLGDRLVGTGYRRPSWAAGGALWTPFAVLGRHFSSDFVTTI
jgi:hypothetical protein